MKLINIATVTVALSASLALSAEPKAAAPKPAASQHAAAPKCTIHPPKGSSKDALAGLAKVEKDDAQKTAIDSLKATGDVDVAEAELEVEHTCLVWSFDLKVPGKKGMEEVQVDAGDGSVLRHFHETAVTEKNEVDADKKAKKASDK